MPCCVMTIGTIMCINSFFVKQYIDLGTEFKCFLYIYSFGNARMVRSYCEMFISVWFNFLMYQIFYVEDIKYR